MPPDAIVTGMMMIVTADGRAGPIDVSSEACPWVLAMWPGQRHSAGNDQQHDDHRNPV
jgi:hypothetical protein